jgi:predicted GNAT family N-acyltransferase
MFEFREIAFGSDQYKSALSLREDVLRKPLGLKLISDDVQNEDRQFHFGLFDPVGNLVACVIASPADIKEVQVRHVAVSESYQGKGSGLVLLSEMEKAMRAKGFCKFYLNSRMHISGFYKKAGYLPVGDEFDEIGVPHIKMVKEI